MKQALEYVDASGRSPFRQWFDGLDAHAAAKVSIAIARLEFGNTSNLKPVGRGVSEIKIDFGPGYRVYVGQVGDVLVILLGGGTKQRQDRDIAAAKERWADYKLRKRGAV
jgi:putative addiction module killer protein